MNRDVSSLDEDETSCTRNVGIMVWRKCVAVDFLLEVDMWSSRISTGFWRLLSADLRWRWTSRKSWGLGGTQKHSRQVGSCFFLIEIFNNTSTKVCSNFHQRLQKSNLSLCKLGNLLVPTFLSSVEVLIRVLQSFERRVSFRAWPLRLHGGCLEFVPLLVHLPHWWDSTSLHGDQDALAMTQQHKKKKKKRKRGSCQKWHIWTPTHWIQTCNEFCAPKLGLWEFTQNGFSFSSVTPSSCPSIYFICFQDLLLFWAEMWVCFIAPACSQPVVTRRLRCWLSCVTWWQSGDWYQWHNIGESLWDQWDLVPSCKAFSTFDPVSSGFLLW